MTLVREGEPGVVLPEYSAIIDPNQDLPVNDTQQWIDTLLNANEHVVQAPSYSDDQVLMVPTDASFLAIQRTGLESKSWETRTRAVLYVYHPQWWSITESIIWSCL